MSLAAVYVAGEEGDGGPDEPMPSRDEGGKTNAHVLSGDVLTAVDAGCPTLAATGGSVVEATGTTVVSLATGQGEGGCAVSATGGSSVSLADGSAASARGLRSQTVLSMGQGSSVVLSASSAYASGKDCAALVAAGGGTVTMGGGQLEATGGSAVRVEGAGSAVRVSRATVLSRGTFAELVGPCTLELSGMETATQSGPAVYVAAGVPTVRLRNGACVRGTVVVAPGADVALDTDATSHLDGRVVYLRS